MVPGQSTSDTNVTDIELEIRAAEQRLQCTLPPTYRSFLLTQFNHERPESNALGVDGTVLLPPKDLVWMKDSPEYAEFASVWINGDDNEEISTEEHTSSYGDEQDSVRYRTQYIPDCLLISEVNEGLFLLNPAVRVDPNSQDEWEAWHHTFWYPGAVRCRNFEQLRQECEDDADGEE